MHSLLLISLLLALAAVAAGEQNFFRSPNYEDEAGELGKGCCLPTQWEGRVGSFYMRRRLLRPVIRISDSKVGFDLRNKKIAARSMLYCRKSKKVYRARSIADFRAKKAYFIFNNKCKVHRMNATLNRPCIPSSFRKFSSYSYGAGSNSLRLSPYGLRNRKLEYFLVVTSGGCVPVKGAYRTRRGHRTRSAGRYQYYNITSGNSDRSMYQVPDICRRAVETEPETLGGKFRRMLSISSEPNAENPFTEESELNFADNESMSHVQQLLNGNTAMIMNSRPIFERRRLMRRLQRMRDAWNSDW